MLPRESIPVRERTLMLWRFPLSWVSATGLSEVEVRRLPKEMDCRGDVDPGHAAPTWSGSICGSNGVSATARTLSPQYAPSRPARSDAARLSPKFNRVGDFHRRRLPSQDRLPKERRFST